jgi:hypothetical protein
MAAAQDIEALLLRFGSAGNKLRRGHLEEGLPSRPLALCWPELEELLPDGGLPRGVVELSAPRALGGSTSIALAAVRGGQARGKSAWCAWLDPEGTLHAPGVVAAGIELARMLVVRVSRAELSRVAVKVVGSSAFEVVVIDCDAIPGAVMGGESVPAVGREPSARRGSGKSMKGWAPEVLVRKLALAAEASGATVLLLTDALRQRSVPWPVALRIELSRPNPAELVVKVAKDKRGRVGSGLKIAFRPVLLAAV